MRPNLDNSETCLSADEAAPEPQAIGWLTFYFLSGPVGLAFGFFLGRTVVEYANWRYAFFIEAGVVLPLALLCFGLKPFDLRRWARHNNQGQGKSVSSSDLQETSLF